MDVLREKETFVDFKNILKRIQTGILFNSFTSEYRLFRLPWNTVYFVYQGIPFILFA